VVRPHLLAWQWSDYVAKHRDRGNLLIHIVAVPLFQLGTLFVLWGLLAWSVRPAIAGAVLMLAALVLEGRGHRREPETPTPFAGPADFVSRFFVEQWVTFPRFVLSGAWGENLRRAVR
jgi:hypothetical protein